MGNRKKRRTQKEIEDSLSSAVEELVLEKGFTNIKIVEIMEKADMEPQVIYNRFNGLEDLFDKYVRKYDYWLHDLIASQIDKEKPVSSLKNALDILSESLDNEKIIQRILGWEISDRNNTTIRTANNREIQLRLLFEFFRENLPDKTNFDCLVAVIIGGIYYITLHKGMSTFCGIDFNREENQKLLSKTIKQIVDSIYSQQFQNSLL